jgi:predicted Fe-Mo cluster-binding NifX family protein
MNESRLRIAVPLEGDAVSSHFGHPESFLIVTIEGGDARCHEERLEPPPHQPGVLPVWLAQQGVNVVIAGGIGGRAVNLLESNGTEVVTGVPPMPAREAVQAWLDGSLEAGGNTCTHHHGRC